MARGTSLPAVLRVDCAHRTQGSVGEGGSGSGPSCVSHLPCLLQSRHAAGCHRKMGALGVGEKSLRLSCTLTAPPPCPTAVPSWSHDPGLCPCSVPSMVQIVQGLSSFCFSVYLCLGSFVSHSWEQFICSRAPRCLSPLDPSTRCSDRPIVLMVGNQPH